MADTVLGLFAYVDRMLEAAKRLKSAGYGITMISSVPLVHEIEHEFGEQKSFLKFFTLYGALSGVCFGTVFVLGTAALYVLPRGGRPIFSITPTLLISYETTILLGVIFTLLGFLLLARIPTFRKGVDPPEVAVDSFGLIVDDVLEDRFEEVEKILKEYGAKEVRKVEDW